MMRQTLHTGRGGSRVSGFTLIEMLISVSLVLLMMVLFAEVFGLASSSMTLQRAIADNDQQVRAFSTILRGDLQKRTFRDVVPYSPLESIDAQSMPYEDRAGYVYLSLNDPDNAVDNLLQFTVRSSINLENGDETPYYGRASGLTAWGNHSSKALVDRHVRSNSHQPEHDDGELDNSTGSSTAAEVCYFVRSGRLYRRVVLLREPLGISGSSDSDQPRATWDVNASTSIPNDPLYFDHANLTNTSGAYMVQDSSGTNGWRSRDTFWRDFDYACYASNGTRLISGSALRNSIQAGSEPCLGRTFGLVTGSQPRSYRFGFDQETGISREFSHPNPGTTGFFFLGRYTLEEQSSTAFTYPQRGAPVGVGTATNNPMSYTGVPALVDAVPAVEPDGVVDALVGGTRRGQDILLSNVHGFEIEIWDDRIGDFVLPGHSLSNGTVKGDYHRDRCQQLALVPGSAAAWTGAYDRWRGRIFDTWHPYNDADNNPGTGPLMTPPYRAMTYYPPTSVDGPVRNLWQANTNYNAGDIVFPTGATPGYPRDYSIYYQCITAGRSTTTEPAWTSSPGSIVEAPIAAPMTTPEPRWGAVLNVRPLRALRLQVRFLHVSSGQVRQVTLIHPLLD